MKIWLILEIVLASVSMAAFGSVYAQSSAQTATQQSAQSESKTAQDKPAQDKTDMWRMMQVVGHPDTTLHELDGFNHGQMAEPAHPLLVRFIQKISKSVDKAKN